MMSSLLKAGRTWFDVFIWLSPNYCHLYSYRLTRVFPVRGRTGDARF